MANGDSIDFTGDAIALKSTSCANIGNDALGSTGTAVVTHRYTLGATVGDGAAVMNANPVGAWNTILMSFAWENVTDPSGRQPGNPEVAWVDKILTGVLPDSIRALAHPTDVPERTANLPRRTMLHQNVPNPFNPVTTIRFDLTQAGRVSLVVYDVAGRRVRTLLDAPVHAGWNHRVTWNGEDNHGHRVASGIYLCRMSTPGYSRTMKMVTLR